VVSGRTRRVKRRASAPTSVFGLDAIISIAADAIVCLDRHQEIVLYNEGAERIFGWTRDEMLGQSIDRLLPERFRDGHRDHVRRFATEGPGSRRMEERSTTIRGRRKSGEEFPAEASISNLGRGSRTLVAVILRDISASKNLEAELRRTGEEFHRLYESAQKAVRERDEVLTVLAHDLRNPLAVARLSAAALTTIDPEENRAEMVRACAERIDRALRQADRLIEDLLAITRIESGNLDLEVTAVTPRGLIHEAVEALQPLAAAASLQLETELPRQLPSVRADQRRIHQVFSNLVGNAIKFTPRGGTIVVSAEAGVDEVIFRVMDTGPGISATHLPHVFERFWQERRADDRGTGLGLAIAKGIVEAHRGRIWAESAPGRGSTFCFSLPPAASLDVGTPAACGAE
jgi:PAS domain S-box-containing protein